MDSIHRKGPKPGPDLSRCDESTGAAASSFAARTEGDLKAVARPYLERTTLTEERDRMGKVNSTPDRMKERDVVLPERKQKKKRPLVIPRVERPGERIERHGEKIEEAERKHRSAALGNFFERRSKSVEKVKERMANGSEMSLVESRHRKASYEKKLALDKKLSVQMRREKDQRILLQKNRNSRVLNASKASDANSDKRGKNKAAKVPSKSQLVNGEPSKGLTKDSVKNFAEGTALVNGSTKVNPPLKTSKEVGRCSSILPERKLLLSSPSFPAMKQTKLVVNKKLERLPPTSTFPMVHSVLKPLTLSERNSTEIHPLDLTRVDGETLVKRPTKISEEDNAMISTEKMRPENGTSIAAETPCSVGMEVKTAQETEPSIGSSSTAELMRQIESMEDAGGGSSSSSGDKVHSRRRKSFVSKTKKRRGAKSVSTDGSVGSDAATASVGAPNGNVCVFCRRAGDIPACEGILEEVIGPFGQKLRTHRNCAIWAPEVYENDEEKLHNVRAALFRARKAVCIFCHEVCAPISCMYGGNVCCLSYHFRCGVLGGARFTATFETFCPTHGKMEEVQKKGMFLANLDKKSEEELMKIERCAKCDGSNYNMAKGPHLTCVSCGTVSHAQCLKAPLRTNGVIENWTCLSCKKCGLCSKSGKGDREQLKCVGCKRLFHSKCVQNSKWDMPQSTKGSGKWRCELCIMCVHCERMKEIVGKVVDGSCRECTEIYVQGDFCPDCNRVYRMDDDNMVNCDSCDKWVHGACEGLDEKQLEKIGSTDEKWFCKLCKKNGKEKVAKIFETKRKAMKERLWWFPREDSLILPNGKDQEENAVGSDAFVAPSSVPPSGQVGPVRRNKRKSQAMTAGTKPKKSGVGSETESKRAKKVKAETTTKKSTDENEGRESTNYGVMELHVKSAATLDRLAVGVDLCISCGASASCSPMRFCATCGEGYHNFCLDHEIDTSVVEGTSHSSFSRSNMLRFASGSMDVKNAPPWRCPQCCVCEICGSGGYRDHSIIVCDYCDRGFHTNCLTPILEDVPQGQWLCADCRTCDMCRKAPLNKTVGGMNCCKDCENVRTQCHACSICGDDVNGKIVLRCHTCNSLVHAICDEVGQQSYMELLKDRTVYHCTPCRTNDGVPDRAVVNAKSGFRVLAHKNHVFQTGRVDTDATQKLYSINGKPICQVTLDEWKTKLTAGNEGRGQWKHSCADDLGDSSQNGAEKLTFVESEERQEINVRYEKQEVEEANDAEMDGNSNDLTADFDDDGDWSERSLEDEFALEQVETWDVKLRGDRTCEFCQTSEENESTGRLLPAGLGVWAHSLCAIWSSEVRMDNREKGLFVNVGLALTRGRVCKCTLCNKPRATVGCVVTRCPRTYHFPCGIKAGCVLYRKDNLLRLACPAHANQFEVTQADLHEPMGRLTLLPEDERMKRYNDRETLQSPVRTGAITMIRTGQIVADIPRYHDSDALYPVSYRACRQFYSPIDPKRRCVYYMSIAGDVNSGPLFCIRCQDDPDWTIIKESPQAAWSKVLERVYTCRETHGGAMLSWNNHEKVVSTRGQGLDAFGLSIPAVSFVLERQADAPRCENYHFSHFVPKRTNFFPRANATGCARTEGVVRRHIAQKSHFQASEQAEDEGLEQQRDRKKGAGRVSAVPVAVLHRKMLRSWKTRTMIKLSTIQGLGLFAVEDHQAGEIVIEYCGELIRAELSDRREAYYDSKGIGCYMFRLESNTIIDATMTGNPARFINHSCDPNCFSRNVTVDNGRKAIVIITKRPVLANEEFTYDYQFNLDDDDSKKLPCNCGAPNCRTSLN